MKQRSITLKQLEEYILWLIAYIPITSLLFLKYLQNNFLPKTLEISICDIISIDFMDDIILYLFLLTLTLVSYNLCNKSFISNVEKKIADNKTKLYVRKYEQISINEYSFFILSLLLPFLSHNTDNTLDLLLALSVIFMIIGILVKKDQMIINPIFLFSKCNVFTATIEIDGIKKKVYVISLEESLDSDFPFIYFEYFKGIYYVKEIKN